MTTPVSPDPGATRDDANSLTLYCLAHAGGSAIPYTRWNRFLPAGVRVEPLELPGHGARLREPLLEQVEPIVADLLRTVGPRRGAPFALFGHSFGAVLAFELTRRLVRLGTPPAALLVAGRNGPTQPLAHRPIHNLDDEAFVAALIRFGGMPQALLEQPELLRIYLPVLRVDLRLAETHPRPPGPPFDVPVTAFGGRRDVLADPEGLLTWERETTGEFELALLPGGHFFLDEPAFHSLLLSRLARLTPRATGNDPLSRGTTPAARR
ncbi:S-acyl fatty acid synthase thioesterase [Wenjunlia vitaminophila]|uniref:S-acyl fatty acid synthase thioesterase n=1 Tax=Wenjunlia vitaminophila TaxID=76728 RepID=A0A0T6LU86_WENVI|nr:alpha/beta fold hydrolase [Wenjunlia vitaminophila]KRV49611.1 S-acyl fatty acid synthase thioesterase [Wenjunlia vitaminophila]